MKTIAILMLPPVKDYLYEELVKEQPGIIESPCPECNQSAWLSTKKAAMIKLYEYKARTYWAACYDCVIARAQSDPEFLRASKRVDI